jgi:hypothetical protein
MLQKKKLFKINKIMNQIETIRVDFEGNKKQKIEDAFKIVKETIKKYNENNYKVVSVTPLTSSDYYLSLIHI